MIQKNRMKGRYRRGLTRIEALVILFFIVIVLVLGLPALQQNQELARRDSCQRNFWRLTQAVMLYIDRNQMVPQSKPDSPYAKQLHWFYEVLPEVGQPDLHTTVRLQMEKSISWDKLQGMTTLVPSLLCPSDGRSQKLKYDELYKRDFACTNIVGIVGTSGLADDGVFPNRFITQRAPAPTGNVSSLICLGERPIGDKVFLGIWQASQEYGHDSIGVFENASQWPRAEWYRGISGDRALGGDCPQAEYGPGRAREPCDQTRPWSYHPNGSNFSKLDGAVDLISYKIDSLVLRRLVTRDEVDSF